MSAFGPERTYLHLPLAAPMNMLPMGLVTGAIVCRKIGRTAG